MERMISKIAVEYQNRLTRLGFKTLEELLRALGVEITASSHEDREQRKELVEDLITITPTSQRNSTA
jgi:predicted site-specific integrase-resolvase